MQTLYEILGVNPTCSQKELHSAWRKAAARAHPDVNNGNDVKGKEINAAYDQIKTPALRVDYDTKLATQAYYTLLDRQAAKAASNTRPVTPSFNYVPDDHLNTNWSFETSGAAVAEGVWLTKRPRIAVAIWVFVGVLAWWSMRRYGLVFSYVEAVGDTESLAWVSEVQNFASKISLLIAILLASLFGTLVSASLWLIRISEARAWRGAAAGLLGGLGLGGESILAGGMLLLPLVGILLGLGWTMLWVPRWRRKI